MTNDATGTHISISGEASSFLEWARGGELIVTVPPELGRRPPAGGERQIVRGLGGQLLTTLLAAGRSSCTGGPQ